MATSVVASQVTDLAVPLGRITPVSGQLRFLEQLCTRDQIAKMTGGTEDGAGAWSDGDAVPGGVLVDRIRHAFTSAWVVSHYLPASEVWGWFATRRVGGVSAARAIREDHGAEVVARAHRQFESGRPGHRPRLSCGHQDCP